MAEELGTGPKTILLYNAFEECPILVNTKKSPDGHYRDNTVTTQSDSQAALKALDGCHVNVGRACKLYLSRIPRKRFGWSWC